MTQAIVVFDGECALCNGFVAWLLEHDRSRVFRIAGSAGPVGSAVLERAGLPAQVRESTIVLWDGSRGLVRSDAVLAIASQLPRPWLWLRFARIVPRSWRDAAYRYVAARRSRVDAEDPACGVPPADAVARWRAALATPADLGEPAA